MRSSTFDRTPLIERYAIVKLLTLVFSFLPSFFSFLLHLLGVNIQPPDDGLHRTPTYYIGVLYLSDSYLLYRTYYIGRELQAINFRLELLALIVFNNNHRRSDSF